MRLAIEARQRAKKSGTAVKAARLCRCLLSRFIRISQEWASDFAMVFTLKEGLVTHWRPIFDYTAEAMAYQS